MTASTPYLGLRRSDSQRQRVTLSDYRGRTSVDLRVWYLPDGRTEWRPSRAGVTLRPYLVGGVVQALTLAARAVDPMEGR